MFDQHPVEGKTPSFKGSMLMIVAEDADKAMEIIKGDIYTQSGVWDLEKAQIIPVCYIHFLSVPLGFFD